MRYCEMKENARFGRIEFAISYDVTPEFKTAVESVDKDDWHRVYKTVDGQSVKTKREWAEVCFVPNAIAFSKNAPVYRYIATRGAARSIVCESLAVETAATTTQSRPSPTETSVPGGGLRVFVAVTSVAGALQTMLLGRMSR